VGSYKEGTTHARPPKPERPTVPLMHRPTLDRAQVWGRVLAMIAKADQPGK
jgi:hypothetical protein